MRRALLLWCAAQALACSTVPDVELARDILGRATTEPPPMLRESPAASLPAVTGLRAVSGELRSVPLRWDPLLTGDVAGYVVERAIAPEGRFERVTTATDRFQTAWVDRGNDLAEKVGARRSVADLGDGNTYHYRVRPFDSRGQIGAIASEVVKASTAPRPAPPQALQVFSGLPRRVALAWEPSPDPGVAGYVVLRSPTQGGEYRPIARVDGRFRSAHIDAGLGDLRVLYYRVAAVNRAGGQGEPTEPQQAVTKAEPLPPAKVQIAARDAGRVRLRWEPNVEPDLARYTILRREEDGDEVAIGSVAADQQSFEDAALPEGGATYRIVAVDRDGLESLPSPPLKVD